MFLSFKYQDATLSNGNSVKRPLIPVTLENDGKKVDAISLLDSGADISMVNMELASRLGMDLKAKRNIARSLGGPIKVIRSEIGISIEAGDEEFQMTIPVLVNLEPTIDVESVIGRAGFFQAFKISFIESQDTILLEC
jgi:hypothetical protein